ncbi:small s [Fusarium beomiforme]|uniref:Small s n=1 Tax=Fusarium beomiforme TaxID=44412 RepID=A0A9P5AAX7_9HYPO|nr:small s [Fusarium beomiforme]
MATGLEALGAASAVLQLISFSENLLRLTFKIYNGTSCNGVEEYAAKMLDAAQRVQARSAQVPRGTLMNDKIFEVSQKCIDAAEELRKETQHKRYQKRKVFKALYFAFRTDKFMAKINELDRTLRMCKEVMETEILLHICDKSAAIKEQQSQGFHSLEVDVQSLISQIATGRTRLETIVIEEARAARDHINTQLMTISDNHRQRILRSLKPEEIRQRYNDVLTPSDASFERVFASYERVCSKEPEDEWHKFVQLLDEDGDGEEPEEIHEIDQLWERFGSWLQTNDKLFWIQGKPGSGKSTLIKFILNNGNTRQLLDSWSPGTRVLSHFFWKIGSDPQNSIKGLLCTLLHDALCTDNDAIDQVLNEFEFSRSKDFYKEWSSQEAEEALLSLFHRDSRSTCIFIDGLDEVSSKDGFTALMAVIQRLISFQKVKVCVSSRPETELINRLETLGSQNLRLEDLTKPEMAMYLLKEFGKLPHMQVSNLPLETFTVMLLNKAQGVFLWLVLATRSVIKGIMNGDDKETLSRRLEELPEELEALYNSMWERLNGNNRIYRETAATYFRYIISDGWETRLTAMDREWHSTKQPTLAQLSLAVKVEEDLIFPPEADQMTLAGLNALCTMTEMDIGIRCAGLLQVGQHSSFSEYELPVDLHALTRPVQFIHRTAHDFLVDTQAGQFILDGKPNKTTCIDKELKLLKCRIKLVDFYYQYRVKQHAIDVITDCNRLKDNGTDQVAILKILPVIKDLYDKGALDIRRSGQHSLPSFPCVAAYYFSCFEDFVVSCFLRPNSPEFTTNSLHDVALQSIFMPHPLGPPAKLIQKILTLGGDAHVAKESYVSFKLPGHDSCVTQHTTVFESLLRGAMNHRLEYVQRALPSFLAVIDFMVRTCPNLHRKILLFIGSKGDLINWNFLAAHLKRVPVWAALEVDLQFLLRRLLTVAHTWDIPTEPYQLQELVSSFDMSHARIRHVGTAQRNNCDVSCYRILDQAPFQGLIHSFEACKPISGAIYGVLAAMEGPLADFIPSASRFPPGSIEKAPFEEELDSLVQDGIGLYRTHNLNDGFYPFDMASVESTHLSTSTHALLEPLVGTSVSSNT